ncbi:MAG: hypothetical protein JO349_00455 [Candidatus Eremiobacteraeota bacterium]|nr:hypothetical protein [Candidatus Eremiobacteraeota bacterium]
MGGGILIAAVAAVGILHTMVPDHWAPVAVLARGQGWSRTRTARAAALAGFGHVSSTLLLGFVAWAIGLVAAEHYGGIVNRVSALALIGFGLWIAVASLREIAGERGHDHDHFGHAHLHTHAGGTQHVHWHDHHDHDMHEVSSGIAVLHEHAHAISGRTALLLILGSSPMIEGLPAFFAASSYGPGLLGVMALVFAISTIGTYVVLSTAALGGLERLGLGKLERYGEVLSGAVVACVGVAALLI